MLQTNKVPIEELEQNRNAEVDVRVRDPERWYVVRWDDVCGRVVLVRGSGYWAPSDAEVDEHLARRRMDGVLNLQVLGGAPGPSPVEPLQEPPQRPEPKLWFPDQAHRDAVEAASMKHMTEFYGKQGFNVRDVSAENCGYDVRVETSTGKAVYLVEVKGTSLAVEGFFITANERACSKREPTWRLAIVTNALTSPVERVLQAPEMEDAFSFQALAWRCDAKR